MILQKKIKNNNLGNMNLGDSGQAGLEFVLVAPLFMIFWLTLISLLIDGLGFMVWNSQIEKYLVCAKDLSQQRQCIKIIKQTQKKIPWIKVDQTQLGHVLKAPKIELQLEGLLIKKYEIKKYLDLSTWKQ